VWAQYATQVKQGTQVDLTKTSYSDPRFKLYNNLQADAARFASFREAQKERELKAAKTDLDKKRVEKRYQEYLLTEKQTIFANSAAAEAWMGFEENADLYPNLEYRTAGDSDVRPEHARLHGIILPMNDDFWSGHTPPLGFGCRCNVIQTDSPVNKGQDKYKGYEQTTVPKGFDFNPGVDQRLFSESAGYYTSAPKAEAQRLIKQAESFSARQSKAAVQDYLKAEKSTYRFTGQKGFKEVKISNRDVKDITSKYHENRSLRNSLLFDIGNVLKESKFVYSRAESKGRDLYVRWHYYQVEGYDNMYLNLVETKYGELKLHAITDKLAKK